MRLSTLVSLVGSGQLLPIRALVKLSEGLYKAVWLATAGEEGVLAALADGPRPLGELATALQIGPEGHEALEAWLQVGVDARELALADGRYRLVGALARTFAQPAFDPLLAMLQEISDLHLRLIQQTPARLRSGQAFTMADQDGELVARSSRVVEPFIADAVRDFVPPAGPVALLEIGCGTGTHLRPATERNPQLVALGLELQPEVAQMAKARLGEWGLADRVRVEAGDVLRREPDGAWDLATLHQNIYYFETDRRVALFRHVAGFLKPGGRLLLTTSCRGGSPTMGLLDLWGAATAGAGRLPLPVELLAQLGEAGFVEARARRLLPGETFFSFEATRPVSA